MQVVSINEKNIEKSAFNKYACIFMKWYILKMVYNN